jgi:hypothetical protein
MVPAPFIVLLDANVLFRFSLRDTLLRAAAAGFYQVRWADRPASNGIRLSLCRRAGLPLEGSVSGVGE